MADQTNNLSAGTQVVSRVEVRGTNYSLVHPRGAVANTNPTARPHCEAVNRFHIKTRREMAATSER